MCNSSCRKILFDNFCLLTLRIIWTFEEFSDRPFAKFFFLISSKKDTLDIFKKCSCGSTDTDSIAVRVDLFLLMCFY